jgi:hypothetical protein
MQYQCLYDTNTQGNVCSSSTSGSSIGFGATGLTFQSLGNSSTVSLLFCDGLNCTFLTNFDGQSTMTLAKYNFIERCPAYNGG